MKNKVLLSVGLLMGIFGAGLHATDPGFDFMNKTGKPVFIGLVNNGQDVFGRDSKAFVEVKPAVIMPLIGNTIKANNMSYPLNISRDTVLAIIVGQTRQEVDASPKPNYIYTFTPNKKIYVTFKDGKLTPQTGPGGGKKGIIEAGYSKDNMITQDDIKVPTNLN